MNSLRLQLMQCRKSTVASRTATQLRAAVNGRRRRRHHFNFFESCLLLVLCLLTRFFLKTFEFGPLRASSADKELRATSSAFNWQVTIEAYRLTPFAFEWIKSAAHFRIHRRTLTWSSHWRSIASFNRPHLSSAQKSIFNYTWISWINPPVFF